jgi:PST family polysaccharide transporter
VAFFHFGKYVWMLTMLDTFGGGLDRLIIGHIYGPGPLGLYTMGYMIATMVTLQIATLIHKIAYPYFCAIRADPLQLQKAVETSYNYITLASIPAALGISSIAPLFVKVVLTSKWAGAVPLVGIFALFGIFLAMAALVTPLMQAIGRPAIPLYILVSQYLLKAAALFLLSGFGISGIGWAVLGVQILATAVSIIIMCQSTGVRLFAIGNAFLRPFTAGLVMSLAVLSFLNAAGLHESRAGAVILAAALVLGAVTFLGASLLVNRGPMLALFALLVQRLRRIRRFNVNPVESPTPFADSSVTP